MNRTVERTFAILQLIAESKGGITLQEIANEMEMAKSSTYVIVQTLLELKILLGNRSFFFGNEVCGRYEFSKTMFYLSSANCRKI